MQGQVMQVVSPGLGLRSQAFGEALFFGVIRSLLEPSRLP